MEQSFASTNSNAELHKILVALRLFQYFMVAVWN